MPEQLGGLDLDAAGPAQRLGDVLAFDVLDVVLEVEARLRAASSAGCCRHRQGSGLRRVTDCSGRLSGRMVGVRSSATARSIAFSSSRMLPGQAIRPEQRHAPPRRCPVIGLPHLLRELRHEVLGEQRDVVAALAQRRQPQRDDVDPVEEVLAEPALGAPSSRGRGWWRR